MCKKILNDAQIQQNTYKCVTSRLRFGWLAVNIPLCELLGLCRKWAFFVIIRVFLCSQLLLLILCFSDPVVLAGVAFI